MTRAAFAPAAMLDGGGPGGRAWWVWAMVGIVVVLNVATVRLAMRRRDGAGPPVRPPGERRLRSASVLVWSAILLVSLLIGLGIASVGPG